MGVTKAIVIGLIGGLVGLGVGYRLMPKKIEIQTKTIEKIVTKRDIVTVVATAPDGSSTTTTTDRSIDETNSKTDSNTKITRSGANWAIGGGALWDIGGGKRVYEGRIERRLFGEVWLGATGTSNGQVGVGVTLRF